MVRDTRSPPREYRDSRDNDRTNRKRERDYDDSSRKRESSSRYPDRDRERRRDDDRRRRDSREREGSSRNPDRQDKRGEDRDRDRYENRERERNRDGDRRDRRERDSDRRRSASPPSRRSRSQSKSSDREDKAKPNFGHSGLLAAATKTVKHADGTGTVLKYHEPPEARKPTVGWRLYVFKGKDQTEVLHIHRQSAYLVGRDRLVTDIFVEHPSCSKQHAAIQFRQIREKNEFGDAKTTIKPFIIDLESTNGTMVNDETIPTSRYFELKLGDVIKFGESAREYVLLSEDAA